jgi:hypothetical protein
MALTAKSQYSIQHNELWHRSMGLLAMPCAENANVARKRNQKILSASMIEQLIQLKFWLLPSFAFHLWKKFGFK